MTQSARDLENTFERAIDLLVHNWVLIVPGLVLAVVGSVLEILVVNEIFGRLAITGNGSADAAAAIQAFGAIVGFMVAIAVATVQMAYVTGMSGSAWQHGRASLRDGWDALAHRWLHVAAAFTLLLVIGFCAMVLSTVTFFVPTLVYAVFFIYTMAAVVIGGKDAIGGIVQSAQIALANLLPTVAVIALICLLAVIGGWLGNLLSHFSAFAGWLVAGIFQQVTIAFASLVVAGEYLKLQPQESGS
jgi:hypothetical protein